MQVSVETTGGLERRMTVEIPRERVDGEVKNRLQRLARTTKLKGFRPGKVPLKIVEQRFGNEVRQEVLGEVIQSSFYEAVTQEQLHPAGTPRIEPIDMEQEEGISFAAVFEVMPEVELSSLEGVAFDKPVVEITDADVDQMLETLRKQQSDWAEVERPAEDGDRVTIDFKGTIDGEPFEGGEGQDMLVTIGGGRMIEGFEEGLKGAAAGEERTLELTFPEEYPHKELAGKPAQFAVTVKKVEAPRMPELDDDFAARFGVEEGGVEALRQEVRRNMEREVEQTIRSRIKQQVMDKLLEKNPLEVPQALVDQETQALLEQTRQNMHIPRGKEGINLDPKMFEDQAKRRVSLGLLLSKAVHDNELKAEPAQIRELVEKIAAGYEQPEEVINWYYADQKRLAEVESVALEDRVVEWALEQGDVNEVKTSFDEVMNRDDAGQG